MIENLGGVTPFICFILLLILMTFFSIRFIFLAEKFAEERGYQENTAIIIRLVGAFMASYLITAIIILFGTRGLEGTLYYFLSLRITFVLIFLLMVGQYLKLPKDYGIKPSPQPVIASALGFILIQIILSYN